VPHPARFAAATLIAGSPLSGGPSGAATETPQSAVLTVLVFLAIGGLTALLFFRQELNRPPVAEVEAPEDPDDTETLTELAPAPPAGPPSATLHISSPGGEQVVAVDSQDLVLGRDPTCAVAIADPQVSRRHARIYLNDRVRWVEDLHSLNGTLVNGLPVTRVPLSDGDEIALGDTRLVFRLAVSEAGVTSPQGEGA